MRRLKTIQDSKHKKKLFNLIVRFARAGPTGVFYSKTSGKTRAAGHAAAGRTPSVSASRERPGKDRRTVRPRVFHTYAVRARCPRPCSCGSPACVRACVRPPACVRVRQWWGHRRTVRVRPDWIVAAGPVAPPMHAFRTRTRIRTMIINTEADWPTGQCYRVLTPGQYLVRRADANTPRFVYKTGGWGFFLFFFFFLKHLQKKILRRNIINYRLLHFPLVSVNTVLEQ